MVLDIFKGINLTAGQEVRAQDIKDLQNFLLARVLDGMLEKLVPGPPVGDHEAGSNIMFPGTHGANVPSNQYAYCLSTGGAYPRRVVGNNTKVQIAPGTLFQKVAAAAGTEPTFLPYTFAGTEEVTIGNGDATNPRVDLVQMKLELVDDDSQARVISTAGVKASRDLNPLTANCETVIRARAAGFGGNAISIQFVADGAGVGSLTQSGYALTFHYATGVTTVANFETAVAASGLIEVQTTDGAGTLTSPGDTFGPVFLSGGTDQVLSSANVMMKRRVQLTLSVKVGTPAASPTYPDCDAGYVAIAGVVVPATWTGASPLKTVDTAGAASLILHDQRMPLGTPRPYHVLPRQMYAHRNASKWLEAENGFSMTAQVGGGDLHAMLISGGGAGEGSGRGRLLAVEWNGSSGPTGLWLNRFTIASGASASSVDINSIGSLSSGGAVLISDRVGLFAQFELNHVASGGGPVVQANALMGPPVWGNGRRALSPPDTAEDNFDREFLTVRAASPAAGTYLIYGATFIMAEGL